MGAFVKGFHISIRDTPLVGRQEKVLLDYILRCFKTYFRDATLFFQRNICTELQKHDFQMTSKL